MRPLAELATILIGVSAVAGLVVRAINLTRRQRRLDHDAYQEKLRRENEDLDNERRRLGL